MNKADFEIIVVLSVSVYSRILRYFYINIAGEAYIIEDVDICYEMQMMQMQFTLLMSVGSLLMMIMDFLWNNSILALSMLKFAWIGKLSKCHF